MLWSGQNMNFSWVIPGKLAGCMGPTQPHELIFLRRQGVQALVRLEKRTISGRLAGLYDLPEFISDQSAPDVEKLDRVITFIAQHIRAGRSVAVSCLIGRGRTGTVLACYLVHQGSSAEAAIGHVRHLRPGSIETHAQEGGVYLYEKLGRGIPGNGP